MYHSLALAYITNLISGHAAKAPVRPRMQSTGVSDVEMINEWLDECRTIHGNSSEWELKDSRHKAIEWHQDVKEN